MKKLPIVTAATLKNIDAGRRSGSSKVDPLPGEHKLTGPIQVAAGALLISFAPILVRVSSVGPTMAGFYRTLFGAIFLILVTLGKDHSVVRRKRPVGMAGLSALLFALGLTFWHRSIHAVGPGVATILVNFQVFFLAAIGIGFLGERIGLRRFAAMPLALVGIYLLVGVDRFQLDLNYRIGIWFGLSAALAYALYVMALRRLQTNAQGTDALANFALVSLLCAAFMGVEGSVQGESFHIPDLKTWLSLIVLGICCQALGWVFISKGLPAIAASRAGLLLLLQPSGAFLWDILFFQRTTTGSEYLGAGLALLAIYFGTKDH